jgi:hypothetical protein
MYLPIRGQNEKRGLSPSLLSRFNDDTPSSPRFYSISIRFMPFFPNFPADLPSYFSGEARMPPHPGLPLMIPDRLHSAETFLENESPESPPFFKPLDLGRIKPAHHLKTGPAEG